MSLLPLILLACSNNQCPEFNPAGTFEFLQTGDFEYSSVTRSGVESWGSLENPYGEEINQSVITWKRSARTLEIEGTTFTLEKDPTASCWRSEEDTGGVTDSLGYARWSGSATIYTGQAGRLSESVSAEGFDLGGEDCNLTQSITADVRLSPAGDEARFTITDSLRFDDSASCANALLSLQTQIQSSRTIPVIFFDWIYAGGLDLEALSELEELSTSFVLDATKVSNSMSLDTGAPDASSRQSRRTFGDAYRPSRTMTAAQLRILGISLLQQR